MERHTVKTKTGSVTLTLHDSSATVSLNYDSDKLGKLVSDIQTIREHLGLLEKWAKEMRDEKKKRDKSDANENTIP